VVDEDSGMLEARRKIMMDESSAVQSSPLVTSRCEIYRETASAICAFPYDCCGEGLAPACESWTDQNPEFLDNPLIGGCG